MADRFYLESLSNAIEVEPVTNLGSITRCDRCGKVQQEAVCEHCLKYMTPTMKIEQWRGFEVHTTERREGKNIWIDEFFYDPKPAKQPLVP